jgi:hypothetical protein
MPASALLERRCALWLERLQLRHGGLDAFLDRIAADDPLNADKNDRAHVAAVSAFACAASDSFWSSSAVPLASSAACSAWSSHSDACSTA